MIETAGHVQPSQVLTLATMPFAKKLARKFFRERAGCGVSYQEIEAAAYFGLCEAATRYDPALSNNFKAYAVARIRGSMADVLRSSAHLTRKHIRETQAHKESSVPALERNRIALSSYELGTLADVLLEAGVKIYTNGEGLVLALSYANENDPETAAIQRSIIRHISSLVEKLPEKERLVIRLKYFEELNFEQMRVHFDGATRSWICRIHARAILRLRAALLARREDRDWLMAA